MKKKIIFPIFLLACLACLSGCSKVDLTSSLNGTATPENGAMGGTPPEDGGTPPEGMTPPDGASAPSAPDGGQTN